MAATPTKVYPKAGFYVPGVPHVAHELPTKGEAEAFVKANPQAFSLDEEDAQPDFQHGADLGIAPPVVGEDPLMALEPGEPAEDAPSAAPDGNATEAPAAGATGQDAPSSAAESATEAGNAGQEG